MFLSQLRRELFPLVARASMFWVPSNTVNFAYSPPSLRVPIVCALSILWNTYFSFVTSRAKATDEVDTWDEGGANELLVDETDMEKGMSMGRRDELHSDPNGPPTALATGFDSARGGSGPDHRGVSVAG